jgi:SAM-dependent methyltransferase
VRDPEFFLRFAPAEHYFWYRKQREGLRLLLRHWPELAARKQGQTTARCVDVGCGLGQDLSLLWRAFTALSAGTSDLAWQWTGIDGQAEALTEARARLDAEGATDITLSLANVTDPLAYPDATFRLVYCSEVIEHLPNPEALLAECARVLEPGGLLLLTTPNQPNLFQRSYWSPARRRANRERLLKDTLGVVDVHGKPLTLHRHISIRPAAEWDAALTTVGLVPIDHGRGALVYGTRPFMSAEWFTAIRSMAEAFLDLWPRRWGRRWSDQVIVLARKQ